MSGIHQFVPMLHVGDAVGQHAVGLQELLRARGVPSEIFVELEDPETAHRTRPVEAYDGEARPADVLVYQFATASGLAARLASRSERLVVNYHNVTPPEHFAPWDNELARHQVRAREELSAVAGRALLGVAVSEWNRSDLVEAGFASTAVVAPIVAGAGDSTGAGGSADAGGSASAGGAPSVRSERGGARWLAVGRLAPNKALEDAIVGLLVYRMRWDPAAELTVIGKPAVPSYASALRSFADEVGLGRAVHWEGPVTDAELAVAYDSADVLVVTSEHEGFCLPAVEAMARGLPVVAYSEGALPEVVGDGGVLLSSKDPVVLSDAVYRLHVDRSWRDQVIAAGRARVEALQLDAAGPRLVDILMAVGAGDQAAMAALGVSSSAGSSLRG